MSVSTTASGRLSSVWCDPCRLILGTRSAAPGKDETEFSRRVRLAVLDREVDPAQDAAVLDALVSLALPKGQASAPLAVSSEGVWVEGWGKGVGVGRQATGAKTYSLQTGNRDEEKRERQSQWKEAEMDGGKEVR